MKTPFISFFSNGLQKICHIFYGEAKGGVSEFTTRQFRFLASQHEDLFAVSEQQICREAVFDVKRDS